MPRCLIGGSYLRLPSQRSALVVDLEYCRVNVDGSRGRTGCVIVQWKDSVSGSLSIADPKDLAEVLN